MGVFWAYTLKVAICLLFFFVFNKLILSKDTFHKFNRVVWLLVLGVSLVLPMFEWRGFESSFVEPLVYVEQEPPISNSNIIPAPVVVGSLPTIVKWSLIAYFSIAIILALKLLFSYIRLFMLIFSKKNHLLNSGRHLDLLFDAKRTLKFRKNINLIVHEKDLSPFSWMNYIVVSRNDLDEDGREILIHELSHIKYKHSWDLILADILIVFQWFNPTAWLYKRSLQEVHEYRADESVLEAGVNAKQYQLLLIKKAVGQRLYSMANSFNHSKLKNRITMMLKEKSNKWAVAKCLYALPLAFLAVSAFANPEVSDQFDDISSVEFTQNYEEKKKKLPLYIVDGKKIGSINDLNPDSIKSINVLKDESAIDKYGRKGRNGVIEITLKAPSIEYDLRVEPVDVSNEVKVIGYGTTEGLRPVGGIVNLALTDKMENKPLIILDGKPYTGSIDDLNQDSIESISVRKDESSIAKYGDKGKNGVIEITLKGSSQEEGEQPQDKVVPYAFVEQKPQFNGGNATTAFSKWVGQNLEYPEEAKKKKIQGRVLLQFIINEDGSMGAAKVLRGIDPLLDAESLRIVSSSPNWTPGENKGKKVKVSYNFPVIFQLN